MSSIEQHGQDSPETPRDARVRRTRRALHGALGALMHERPFESIGVKQILARADVARSTFYAHFDGKEELLVSAIEEAMARSDSVLHRPNDVLRFALPMLEHVERLRSISGRSAMAMLGFHRSAHETLRETIRRLVRRELASTNGGGSARSEELISDHVASTFLVVLEWWLASAPELSSGEVHRHFEELVAPALRSHACS
jgi:AcrR family transcriptional regulator